MVSTARSRLNASDERGLRQYLRTSWSTTELAALLDVEDADVVKIAAICVGLTGTTAEAPALSRTLHHDDYFVVNIAERALWNIWFRASNAQCCAWLREAITNMHAGEYDACEDLLDRILLDDPKFAEASNQRAILHYLTERYASSLMACRRTLALNPYHFGAAAGAGHNHMQLGTFDEAAVAYRHALRLHPRMDGVRQQLRRARENRPGVPTKLRWRRPD
ncbi:MAG: hypothetical protein H6817_05560 [Phycisphaerales bacterium]|nr:hypothetical protein [Phycisphaerales bacterium]